MIGIMTSKILLVEDEAILAMAQAQKLQKNGFDVVLAHKGEHAVDMVAADHDISLVLMDIDLGRGIDGTEAAQRILGDREIPIVFLTSHSEKEYVDKVKKITGYGYVLKNSGEFVLIESINMAYTLFAAKREALQHLHDSESAYRELEVREERLQHVNRVLLSIRHINQIITEEIEVSALIDNACKILIETSGYSKAWAVLLQEGSPVEPFYHAGFKNAGFIPMMQQLRKGVIPSCAAKAMDEGRVVLTRQPSTECPNCPFGSGQETDGCNFGEVVSLTAALQYDNVIYGWISAILPAFYSENPDEIGLFEEIARDIAYALHGLAIDNEKRAVQRALQEREEKYRAMYTNAPLPYQSLDAEGRFIDVNPAWLTTLGYTREEVIGEKFSEFLHPVWKPHFETNFPAFKKRGYVHDVQFKIRHKSGEYRDITFEGCIGYKPDGSVRQTYCVFKDVTEQNRMQHELEAGAKRYRSLFNSIRDAILVTDENRNIIDCNAAFSDLFGYPLDEIKGLKTVGLYENEGEYAQLGEAIQAHKGSLNNFLFTIQYRRKNGLVFPGETSVFYYLNEQNKITGYIGLIRDVSERVRNEAELKESEENLRITLNSIGDAVIATDVEGRVTRMNPVAQSLTGWTIGAALGEKLERVFHIVNADTRKIVDNPVSKVLETGDIIGLANHTMLISRDGREYQVADSASPIKDSAEEIAGVVLVFRDVTEQYEKDRLLQESEAKYHKLVENSPVGIFQTDSQGHPLHVNPAMAHMVGAANPQEAIDNFQELSSQLYVDPQRREEFTRRLREHGYVQDFVYEAKRRDGQRRWFSMNARISSMLQGEKFLIDGFTADISQQKRTEVELRAALREKQFLMQELNHRVKNNLLMITSLISFKESLSKNSADLSDIRHQINAIRIVHEKLYQSKDITHIDARDYFQDLLESIFSSFTERPVSIENQIEDISFETKTLISLGLIVNEIATNAIKYGFTGSEEALFRMSIIRNNSSGEYEISISNSGLPFPAEIELDNTETLGLRLIKALVDQLNGNVELIKSPHPEFTIRIPVETDLL